MNKNVMLFVYVLLSFVYGAYPAQAAVRHVPADYLTIQAGIDAATNGDTVLIADGVYSGPGNWDISFQGKAITVCSENGPGVCIVDCLGIEKGFAFYRNETSASVLQGVCIQNTYTGPAVHIYNASPTISGCHFMDCHSDETVDVRGSALITDCMFMNNTCGKLGGILFLDGSQADITSCLFADNVGVAVHGNVDDTSRITKCIFIGNIGGAIVCEGNAMTIGGEAGLGNYFSGNQSGFGADLYSLSGTVNARYNQFAGYAQSDYYVSPQENFDLSFCYSALVPITQNVYVSPTGDDSNDGLSEGSAFRSIQHALSVILPTETSPLTIYIASGLYSPSASNELFPLPMMSYLTLAGEEVAGTVIDAEGFNTVVIGWKERNFSITDLTMTGGSYGGLFLSDCSDGQISNMHIVGNSESGNGFAAGLYIYGESILIDNTLIENNHSSRNVGGASLVGTNVIMMDSIITGNTGISAGGIWVSGYSELRNSVMANNTSIEYAGGVRAEDDSIVDQCLITQNAVISNLWPSYGGGCFLAGHATLTNSTISENSASTGGGVYLNGYATLTNSTISENEALTGGGIFIGRDALPVIGGTPGCGNYFSSNRAGAGMDLATDLESSAAKNVQYNTFEGIHLSDCFSAPVELFDFTGCVSETTPITQNVFVSPAGNDENDGLTQQTAFRTITHALKSVLADELNPLTVNLDEGVYSASTTGENFPLPIVRHVNIEGSSMQLSVIDAEYSDRVWVGYADSDSHFSDLTVMGGFGAAGGGVSFGGFGPIGGGVLLDRSDPLFDSCLFTGNRAESGGAVCCLESSPAFIDCGFSLNEADLYGGAIILGYESDASIDQCAFNENAAHEGAAIAHFGGNAAITRSVFASNDALLGAAIFVMGSGQPIIGGSSGNGNTFSGNKGSFGVDLFCLYAPPALIIDARYNVFSGNFLSEHYVAPQANFDLTGCSSEFELVTQDVYVSTDGDDTNDGLSWDTALLTISRAMSVVQGTSLNPVTVHLAPGIYSPSTTGESFPVSPVSNSIISGMDAASTILDAEGVEGNICIWYAENVVLNGLTLSGSDGVGGLTALFSDGTITGCVIRENHAEHWGGGIDLAYSDFTIQNSTIENNFAGESGGGGIYLSNSDFAIHNSIIKNNFASESGGGIKCDGAHNTLVITNSLITGNESARNGALCSSDEVTMFADDMTLQNCTISGNSASISCGGIYVSTTASLTMSDCIVWENTGLQIDDHGATLLSCCNVEGGWPGNTNADPLFTVGPLGDFYLSQTAAGDPMDSPCLDSGCYSAASICTLSYGETICLDMLTTRHDSVPDAGTVDMGFHYALVAPEPTHTPTPTMTPSSPPTVTPSAAPTHTPEPTATPLIPNLGVDLKLIASSFQAGDLFLLTAAINNPGPEVYRNQPFVVILDAWNNYYFFPIWASQFECDYMDLPIGITDRELLRFEWPQIDGQGEGIKFYAALLTMDFESILGVYDSVSFGWSD